MAVVSLEEMKNYLRVDFDDDDALLEVLDSILNGVATTQSPQIKISL